MHKLAVAIVVATLFAIEPASAATLPAQQISPSNDSRTERWSTRLSTTSRGQIIFAGGNESVYLYNGTDVLEIHPTTGQGVIEAVLALGTDAASNVIGAWRRGAGSGFVKTSGGSVQEVTLNPEHASVADGCVFMTLQTPASGNHAFQINTATGARTQLSSGTASANFGAFRVASSGCQAVWSWQPSGVSPIDIYYWNGTSATLLDTAVADTTFSFNGGRIVYPKRVSNVDQVFMVNPAVSLTPVQLSTETDTTKFLLRPQTDGRHVAWYRANADGSSAQIILNGGLAFPTGTLGKINTFEFPFQLHRGQLLWTNAAISPRTFSYDDGTQSHTINPAPATDIVLPWLGDGYIAFLGPTATSGGDPEATRNEVFRVTGTTPADASQPSPPMLVIATPGTAQVKWDSVLGATSYNAYVAYQPGVSSTNYQTLTGGRKITGVTSGFVIPDIPPNTTYYVAITAVENAAEGPSSRVASTTFVGSLVWSPVGGLGAIEFFSVAADNSNSSFAYAGANGRVFKSSNGGIDWTEVLTNATTGGTRVAGLAVASPKVFAVTMTQGDIWRSPDNGQNWTRVHDGNGVSLFGAIAAAPSNGNILYSGDFDDADPFDFSPVITSVNGGDNWAHTQEGPSPPDEIGAQGLAVHPTSPTTVYAGSNNTPNVGKSTNGGTTWTSAQIPSGGSVQSLAIHPTSTDTVYASTRDKGVFKSINGGTNWTAKNSGLDGVVGGFSGGAGFNSLLIDPTNPNLLHLGAGNGYWFSLDGGESWNAANSGFGGSPAYINALAMTPSRRLIAATSTGLYMLSFAPAPGVTQVSPSSGHTSGGTNVTITGTNFQSGATVTFGGTTATNVAFVNATTITATTPAHAAGSVAVVVTNPDFQSGTLAGAFSYSALPSVPTGVSASAPTTASVQISWSAAAGATSYKIYRRAPGGGFTEIGTTSNTTHPDNAVVANTSYLYRVRGVNGSGESADSAADLATTVAFTNDPLTAGVAVQAAHIAQLRLAVEAVRQLAGLSAGSFTETATTGGPIKALHITQVRTALDQALTPLGLAAGGDTDPSLTGVTVKAVHVQELRNRMD